MPERTIFGKTIHEAPRREIAGADCWLSGDERWIEAARGVFFINHGRDFGWDRWKADAET